MGKKVTKKQRQDFDFKGGENFNRMNYLFKLGNELYGTNIHLSQTYIGMMKEISKRNALRINKQMKRTICLKCNNLLYKDIATNIKMINQAGKHTAHITCSQCGKIAKTIIF